MPSNNAAHRHTAMITKALILTKDFNLIGRVGKHADFAKRARPGCGMQARFLILLVTAPGLRLPSAPVRASARQYDRNTCDSGRHWVCKSQREARSQRSVRDDVLILPNGRWVPARPYQVRQDPGGHPEDMSLGDTGSAPGRHAFPQRADAERSEVAPVLSIVRTRAQRLYTAEIRFGGEPLRSWRAPGPLRGQQVM
jgi:hypothetical protein